MLPKAQLNLLPFPTLLNSSAEEGSPHWAVHATIQVPTIEEIGLVLLI